MNPMPGQFPAVAGSFDPAKWQALVALHHTVHEGGTAGHAPGEGFAALQIPSPDTAAQAEVGGVGHRQGFLFILDPDHARYRPEQLLTPGTHAGTHALEDGGRVESTCTRRLLATQERIGAFLE